MPRRSAVCAMRRRPSKAKKYSFMSGRFSNFLIVTLISVTYLLLSAWLIGYKTDQLFLVLLFNTLFYLSGPTRRFIVGFSVFIVFWIIFDSMKAFPNYRFNEVHIESLYRAERSLFGIHASSANAGSPLTPNEFWLSHTYP